MQDYLYYVVLMDAVVLLCMIFMVHDNKLLEKRTRAGFIISYALIIFLSVVELFTVIIDKRPGFRGLSIALNFIGFASSPLIPVFFGNSISKGRSIESKIAFITIIIYDVILLISLPFGWIFSVDSANVYNRGPAFPLFLVIYIASKLYLVYASAIMLKKFQHRNNIIVILLLIAFLLGSTIQIFKPDIHTSFSCITLIGLIFYAFFNDLWQQLDRMTGLFSHEAFIARASSLKKGEAIIIMDCDNFKLVNDSFGHAAGDECLLKVAKAIKRAYDHYGICYRIGGDEFAVILFKGANVDELHKKFIEYIRQERELMPIIPYVSFGTAIYNDGTPGDARNLADRIMYNDKENRKQGK